MKRIILLAVLVLVSILNDQKICQTKWEYPIKPGTKEWTKLKSEKEIIAAEQIPTEILRKMTTDEVYKAWLDLPGRMEILAFNTLQIGIDEVRKRFNVLDELLIRKDVGAVAFNHYLQISSSDFRDSWSSNMKGKFITDLALEELLISQPEILDNLTKGQKATLFNKLKKEHEIKSKFQGKNKDFFWVSSGLILGGRILAKENAQFNEKIKNNKELFDPIKRGEIMTKKEFENLINELSENSL